MRQDLFSPPVAPSLKFRKGVFAMSQMIGFTTNTFLVYIVPPIVCQYLMGVLVQLEGTRTYRMALFPIALCSAWRATFVDMSGGDLSKAPMNTMLITQMCIAVTRCAVWALASVPYRRLDFVDNQNKSVSVNVYSACWNAWELLINHRGVGWNWPRGLVIPKPTFETNSRVKFVLSTAVGFVFHAVAYDACAQTIHMLSPGTFGSLEGGSLFDHTLSPVLELLRAILVSCLTAAAAYFGLQYTYHFLTIVFVILFHHHPSQWPPLFDTPWLSTSLNELWGRRWHQLMRDSVTSLGGQPFSFLFGRLGGLLCAFLVSGIFHNFDIGKRGYSAVCLCFWLMNGIGVVLECLWKRATGRLVRGIWGWLWTAGWLLLWGIPMVDAYAKVGRLGALRVFGGLEPSLALVALIRKVFDMSSS